MIKKKFLIDGSPSFLHILSSFKKSLDNGSSCDVGTFQMTENHVERMKMIESITQSILIKRQRDRTGFCSSATSSSSCILQHT